MSSPPLESAETSRKPATAETARSWGRLWSVSFVALVITQFLVSLNDNMFRWLIIPIGKELIGQDRALTAGSLIFLLPFVLLAGLAGYLADRFSKRNVMVGCKVAEIVIMGLGITVILSGNIILMLIVLFMMGAQSTMFSPSKYSSIPEIVRGDRISAANGVIGMTTMVAVIVGTVAGGYLYDWTTPPSILVVHEEEAQRQRLSQFVESLGFRAKQAHRTEEVSVTDAALDRIRSGAPRLVLLDDRLPGTDSIDAASEIHKAAGKVRVLLMTADSDLLRRAAASPGGPDRCLRKPIGLARLRDAIGQLAGPGEPLVTERRIQPGQLRYWRSAAALIGVAVVGWLSSLFIGRLRSANPARRFPVNPLAQAFRDVRVLAARRPLLLASLGSAYFWSLGLLATLNVDKFARPELVTDQQHVGPLLGMMTLGIGLGAALAGVLSGGKVELGLVPFGALGTALISMLLLTVPHGTGSPSSTPYYWAGFWLLALGCCAGLFDIPLLAFLQDRSPGELRGRIMAANNFLSFSGMLLASGVFWLLTEQFDLSGRQIFLVGGLVTIPVFLWAFWLVIDRVAYVLVSPLVRTLYRVRVVGLENVPKEGGALLIPNHVSFLDGILLLLYCPRRVRMVAFANYVGGRLVGRLARDYGVIPIVPGRRSVIRSIRAARDALRQGELVGIFPEGGITRSGRIRAFNPGFLTILKGTGAPVIPVYLDGLWGSVFSFEGGRFFWKWPRGWRRRVSIRFGRPIHEVTQPQEVRLAVQELETEAMQKDDSREMIPARRFLRMCRKSRRRVKLADSMGTELTGAELLMRTLILRRVLRREVLDEDEKNVGVLLPPSAGGVLANAALALDRRVAVNLNYTLPSQVLNQHCIKAAGVRHVLTSRKVLEKLRLDLDAEVVFLEDLRPKITTADKLLGMAQARLLPIGVLERRLGLHHVRPDDLLAIIFTSGSTGEPKGVMLTHRNVGSNIQAFAKVLDIRASDVLVGVLPLFHSFGYTVTLWTVLVLDPKGIYHSNPLEYRQVGKLCGKHGATLLIATPTFLRTYLRGCPPEDFATLEVVVAGAEKLPKELCDKFEQKFGVRPVEGYGTTELSPVVSCNVPPDRLVRNQQQGLREGTVGQPIPGVLAKIVNLDTGEDLGAGKSGLLCVKGPNVMKGYLDMPEKTATVIREGWYETGDVAEIDEDGFIRITDRQSRFSKIGGEMVPHIRVEEAIVEALRLDPGELQAAVTGVPHPTKGERLVVLHTKLEATPEEIWQKLREAGLPRLWIPSPDSFAEVDEIPISGTGKLDLRRLKELALNKFPLS